MVLQVEAGGGGGGSSGRSSSSRGHVMMIVQGLRWVVMMMMMIVAMAMAIRVVQRVPRVEQKGLLHQLALCLVAPVLEPNFHLGLG